MTFRFRFDRTLQAAGVLLQLDEGRMAYIRLLELLSIADRELLAETGRTLTGDTAVAMKNGPVLSRVYDLIKGVASQPEEWGEHIRTIHYSVELKKGPGKGKLSKGDLEKLIEVTERFRHMDDWELSEHTHDSSEWKTRFELAPSSPIPWEEILKLDFRTLKPQPLACAAGFQRILARAALHRTLHKPHTPTSATAAHPACR